MKVAGIEVVLRPGFGAVRAYADVTINFDDGQLTVFGFPVIQKDGRSPWVGFPQKPGSKAGKYFPLMEAKGEKPAGVRILSVQMPGNPGGANWGVTAANPLKGIVYVLGTNGPALTSVSLA